MSQSLAGLRRDQTTLLVWQQQGSRLFNKAGSEVCETRDICILYSRFQGQLHLLSLFLPFNQSEDASWPNAKSPTGSAYVVHCSEMRTGYLAWVGNTEQAEQSH